MKKKIFLALALFAASAAVLHAEVMALSNCGHNGYPIIVPTVKKLSPGTGNFALPSLLKVYAPETMNLKHLTEAYNCGKLKRVNGRNAADCALFISDKDTPENPEGYRLVINRAGIEITSRSERGLFYGIQSLCWMLRNRDGSELDCCDIEDWPDLKMRAVFFELPNIPYRETGRLCEIIELLASLKYNTILIEFADNFPLSDHPFTLRKIPHFRKQDIARIMAAAKANHIELIPKLQVLTHAKWLTRHPDFPRMTEGKPSKEWCSAYCPANAQAQAIVEKVIRETADMLKPRYFHIGLDEFNLCPHLQCPKCKNGDPVKLILGHVLPIQKLLIDRNITPIVYQDDFVSKNVFRRSNKFVKVLDGLDKRTMVNIWQYDPNPSRIQYDDITGRGFKKTIYMSWNNGCFENTYNLPRLAAAVKSEGCILAYWYSLSATMKNLHLASPSSLPATIYQANYSWNAGDREPELLPFDASYEMRRLLKQDLKITGRDFRAVPVKLDGLLDRNISGDTLFPEISSIDLAKIKRTAAAMPEKYSLAISGSRFAAAVISGDTRDGFSSRPLVISVNSKVRGLSMMATAAPYNDYLFAKPGSKAAIGMMEAVYSDGTRTRQPLVMRYNIGNWSNSFGGNGTRAVIRGIDRNRSLFSFYAVDWKNPHPGKTLREFKITGNRKSGVAIAVFAMSAIGDELSPALIDTLNDAVEIDPGAVIKRQTAANDPDRRILFGSEDPKKDASINAFGSNLKGKVIRTTVNEPGRGRVMQLDVPPQKGILSGRLCVDVRIPADAELGTINFDVRVSDPDQISRADCYIIGKKTNTANAVRGYHYFSPSIRNVWQSISLPESIINDRESGGTERGNYHAIRISFWLNNIDKDIRFHFDNISYSPRIFNSSKLIKIAAE